MRLEIDNAVLEVWIEQGWLAPETTGEGRSFREADLARGQLILESAQEVGPSLFFSLLIITVSFLPVFVLGAIAAFAYQRCKILLAPMLVHAIYNAAVLSWQFWA